MGTTGNAGRRELPVELKGKKVTVRELDLKAYGEIENFVKAKHARLFRLTAIGMKPKEINKEIMKIIKSSFTPEELANEMSASDCVFFMAYLAIRHNKGVTEENVGDILDISNLNDVTSLVDAMSDDKESEVNPPEGDQASK